MNVSEALSRLSKEEKQRVVDAATPCEKIWIALADSGAQIYTSENAPPTSQWFKVSENG